MVTAKAKAKWRFRKLNWVLALGLVATFGRDGLSFAAYTPSTLEDCFQAAVRRSETVSDQEERLAQSHERQSQALGNLLPSISGSAAYFIQQSPSDPLTQSFFPSTQPTVKLTLSQPLFRGLREFAALRQGRRLAEAQEYSKEHAIMQLHNNVAQNFFLLLSLEQELKNLDTQVKLYQERINELKERTRTGQSSTSDALTAQAAKAMVLAQMKQISGQYESTRELFAFLTGLPQETRVVYSSSQNRADTSLDEYLKKIEARPDIKAAKHRVDASDEAVSIARGEHFPSLDFQGNYYLVRPTGVFSEIKWDVQATLTLPLYSGGMIQSKVTETASQRSQAELALSLARRSAEQEVRSLYKNYQSDLDQIQALEQSMELAEKNYLVLKKDYTRGLTRNIDVLQALTQFQESKRSLDRVRWNAHSDFTRLQILSAVQPLIQSGK